MVSKQITLLRIAGINGGLAVVLGAFGAHGLEERLSAEMLAIYETGVLYHFFHAIALLAVAAGNPKLWESPWAARACYAWLFGIAVFSGTLYLLAVTETRWLGAITPIGGVALILGWVFVALAAKTAR